MYRSHHLDQAAHFHLLTGHPLLLRIKVTECLVDIHPVQKTLNFAYKIQAILNSQYTIHGLQQVVKQPASTHDRYEVEV